MEFKSSFVPNADNMFIATVTSCSVLLSAKSCSLLAKALGAFELASFSLEMFNSSRVIASSFSLSECLRVSLSA